MNRRRGDRLCGRLRHLVRAHDWPPTSHAGISADQIMNVLELSTPALVVDLNVVERNLDAMAELCRRQGVLLRPHTKTHKTPEVARMQVEHGAIGVTVAKVGEAEVMGAGGLDEILVAYPVIGAEKLRRLATLARERSVLVSLDDERTAQELSRAAVNADS